MKNKFFGSKLNSILLLVLIALMVIALFIMSKNKELYLGALDIKNTEVVIDNSIINSNTENTEQDWKEYKNDELGISFNYPSSCGNMKIVETETDKEHVLIIPTNIENCPIESIGGTSDKFRLEDITECPWPKKLQYNENNFESESGIPILISLPEGHTCEDDIGTIHALVNLKHNLSSGSFIGRPISSEFIEMLSSVKVY